jgi:hypothetical protein
MAQNEVKEELHQLELLNTARGVEDGKRQLEEEICRLKEMTRQLEEGIYLASCLLIALLSPALHCTVFISKLGLLGVGGPGLKKGDKVTIVFGIPMPIVLRCGSAPCYHTMVGKARVNGIMNGELMKFVDDGLLKEKIFHIR